ncbi:peptidoglycan/xylan/chitin deacetylase (PgdA/CDA1 family) [Streptosporangium becharense]|uniref:Peptidoglycan/xylan/chitin deacetylase (PgdA/CDA1 family) n=1 Tax=Streptosporangium becharense TaxID=1816182 RepID=A0A7W9IJL4_9ACTN|nr:polysaccharide deacetylase family protein [Streptosporangium becharense]MBB2911151.1 peptidoglycan/xylan/chitin deacetylase (PgdA/CDA1 family) [Streptosporangium becharense]MBB5821791.1 peptidoglycan/xylan/chitin deacetylase (PgdA/CDA1 family) [Streptosporangium becharense]
MIRVPILMYHSVSARPNAETKPLAVHPSAFADQLAYLADRGFTPLTVADLVATLHKNNDRSLPERPIVLTFDDGYADFHSEALPVLERHGFPSTVFLTSGWVSDAGKDAAGRPLDTMLSWAQAREAVSCGVEIGGHSHSHPQLDQLRDDELRQELRRNKALLEDKIGSLVSTMAYPYGYSSARVRREVRRAGYWAACAVNNAIAADRHDVLALPRLTVAQGTSMKMFSRAVEGNQIPLIYARERALTKGYAVVRRTRYGLRRVRGLA